MSITDFNLYSYMLHLQLTDHCSLTPKQTSVSVTDLNKAWDQGEMAAQAWELEQEK